MKVIITRKIKKLTGIGHILIIFEILEPDDPSMNKHLSTAIKKTSFLIFGFCVLFFTDVDAQCNIKTKISKTYTRNARSNDCSVVPEFATKMKAMFKKGATGGAASFVKSGEEYYMFFQQSWMTNVEYNILENNSLVFVFEEGDSLSLYPCGNFFRKVDKVTLKYLPTNSFACYYSITKEELQRIADNSVERVMVHVVTADKDGEIEIEIVEDGGTKYIYKGYKNIVKSYEYIVKSDNYKNNTSNGAACILTK